MNYQAKWIKSATGFQDGCPVFTKQFPVDRPVTKARLHITARGVYEATLNGKPVGDFVLAPGWTSYEHRLQVQEYDVTALLQEQNTLSIVLAPGWYALNGGWFSEPYTKILTGREPAILCQLTLEYADGSCQVIGSDDTFTVSGSPLQFCDIYDGVIYDANTQNAPKKAVEADNQDQSCLIAQQGEPITLRERLHPIRLITTPKGEQVLDFGQNLTGTVELQLTAKAGDKVELSFGEILDPDGNFYNKNYRKAKAQYRYTCKDGHQTFLPTLTFFGFRYVRVEAFPGSVDPDCFTAVVIHSRLRQTGRITTGNPLLNQLFRNVIWGQKGNYLDVPTDCPQRNERLGWTGDAQVFIKTASYNFDVYRFFDKWLNDMLVDQMENGGVPPVIPAVLDRHISSAWGDAVTICPWQLYQTYGKTEILEKMFPAMKKWVDFITNTTKQPGLWLGGEHYGDWLELKAPFGAYKGATRDDLIASAFYARSTEILCLTGEVLGRDMSQYRTLYQTVKETFCREFEGTYRTQTEYILPLQFNLTPNPRQVAEELVALIHADGDKLQTGFVGTPYILHVLSRYGYHDLAYTLLLREEYPSWLYPVTRGATTIWEHWDGITPDNRLWPEEMNSFNHYAYGAVADWLYEVAAGITPAKPGFAEIRFAPVPDPRLPSLEVEFETPHGLARSAWRHTPEGTVYEITTPVPAIAQINGKTYSLTPGIYRF